MKLGLGSANGLSIMGETFKWSTTLKIHSTLPAAVEGIVLSVLVASGHVTHEPRSREKQEAKIHTDDMEGWELEAQTPNC